MSMAFQERKPPVEEVNRQSGQALRAWKWEAFSYYKCRGAGRASEERRDGGGNAPGPGGLGGEGSGEARQAQAEGPGPSHSHAGQETELGTRAGVDGAVGVPRSFPGKSRLAPRCVTRGSWLESARGPADARRRGALASLRLCSSFTHVDAPRPFCAAVLCHRRSLLRCHLRGLWDPGS